MAFRVEQPRFPLWDQFEGVNCLAMTLEATGMEYARCLFPKVSTMTAAEIARRIGFQKNGVIKACLASIALEKEPRNAAALKARIDARDQCFYIDGVLEDCESYLASHPKDVQIRYRKAMMLFIYGNCNEALIELNRILVEMKGDERWRIIFSTCVVCCAAGKIEEGKRKFLELCAGMKFFIHADVVAKIEQHAFKDAICIIFAKNLVNLKEPERYHHIALVACLFADHIDDVLSKKLEALTFCLPLKYFCLTKNLDIMTLKFLEEAIKKLNHERSGLPQMREFEQGPAAAVRRVRLSPIPFPMTFTIAGPPGIPKGQFKRPEDLRGPTSKRREISRQ